MLRSGRTFRIDDARAETKITPNSGDNTTAEENCHPALQNDVVLRNIFTFMEYAFLKDCRAVCHKWKSICDPSFRKQSNVLFDESATSKDINILRRLFSNTQIPITVLELNGPIQWKAIHVHAFFRNEGRIITKLRLVEQFNLLDTFGRRCQTVDIDPLLISTNLKTLVFSAVDFLPGFDKVKTVVTTDAMLNLDSVSLTGGTIVLSNDCRISPKHLRLSYNKFIRDSKECSQLSIHDFVDFDRMEKLEIQPPYDDAVTFTVDLSGTYSFEDVVLFAKLNLKNWDISRWCVDKLSLYRIPFLERTHMAVTALKIHDAKVDISVLPPTIKKLVLRMCSEVTCTSPVNLNQLECLISENNGSLEFLKHFTSCPNLIELVISNGSYSSKLNVDNIPQSVQRIFLSSQNEFVGDTVVELDSLVVSNICTEPKYLNQFISCPLHPKNLILNIDRDKIYKKSMVNYNAQFKRIIRFRKTKFNSVVFGGFKWAGESTFAVSFLSDWVDKRGEYYMFKNGKRRGKAITLEQIHETVFGEQKAFKDCKNSYWSAFDRTIHLY